MSILRLFSTQHHRVQAFSYQLQASGGRTNHSPGAPSWSVTAVNPWKTKPMSTRSPLARARLKNQPPASARPPKTWAMGEALTIAQVAAGTPGSSTSTVRIASLRLPRRLVVP